MAPVRKSYVFVCMLSILGVIATMYVLGTSSPLYILQHAENRLGYTPNYSLLSPSKNVNMLGKRRFGSEKQILNYYSHCQNITNFRRMASCRFSLIELVDIDPDIVVRIATFDQNNVRQAKGGDVIFVWAESARGDRVAGEVTDHMDGTYTGVIKVFWLGKTKVYAKIAATIENACLKQNARDRFGNAVYSMQKPWGISATFKRNGVGSDRTRCGANPLIYGKSTLCNYTSINDGMPWYCGPPKNPSLTCHDVTSFGTGPFIHPADVTDMDKMTTHGHGVLEKTVKVNVTRSREINTRTPCFSRDKTESWTEPLPSGYWSRGAWTMTNCRGLSDHSLYKYRKCLQNKLVVFMGDSSLREYAEYFIEHIQNKPKPNLKDGLGDHGMYHNREIYYAHNISLTHRKHAMPFHNPNFPPNGIASIPTEILSMTTWHQPGESIILLLHFNVHFQAYPSEQFGIRIKRTAEAVRHLLSIKSGITVFIKGPQVSLDDARWYDPHVSLVYRDIIAREFHDIRDRVVYLDVWSLTISHNSENIHPAGDAFTSQIQQLMSYICDN